MMAPIILHTSTEDDSSTWQLLIPTDLACFPGHFPGMPVLPGAVLVGWALSLAAMHWSVPAICREMNAVKFHRALQPGDTVTLALHMDRTGGKLRFSYNNGQLTHASGHLTLEEI